MRENEKPDLLKAIRRSDQHYFHFSASGFVLTVFLHDKRKIENKEGYQKQKMGIVDIIKLAPVFIAAAIVGNWFLSEVKKAKKNQSPWYTPYISPPGIIILVVILFLPVIVRILGR